MCEVPGTDGFVLLAVFDGHGGDGAAIYAEAELLDKIHQTGMPKRTIRSLLCIDTTARTS